jgi:alpha-glucosidase
MTTYSTVYDPPLFRVSARSRGRIDLVGSTPATAHVFILEDDIVRVMVLPDGAVHQPVTWAIAPGLDDVPVEGRDRFDLSGFTCPDFTLDEQPGRIAIETSRVRLTVGLLGFSCHWEVCVNGEWLDAARDRPTQAYNFGWWDDKAYHYLARDRTEMYFGLAARGNNPENR